MCISGFVACHATQDRPVSEVGRYGAAIADGESVSVSKVVASPEAFADRQIILTGDVRQSCTRRGCWMELADASSAGVRVTFKDYGFFVPTDARGSHARVQGVLAVRDIAPADVAHLEGEGATFEKAPDGTAREIRVVASGVELWKGDGSHL